MRKMASCPLSKAAQPAGSSALRLLHSPSQSPAQSIVDGLISFNDPGEKAIRQKTHLLDSVVKMPNSHRNKAV